MSFKIKITIPAFSIALLFSFFSCQGLYEFSTVQEANSFYILKKLNEKADLLTFEDFIFVDGEDQNHVRSSFSFPVLLEDDISVKWRCSNSEVNIRNNSAAISWSLGTNTFNITAELSLKEESVVKEFNLKADVLPIVDYGNFVPDFYEKNVALDQSIIIPFNVELNIATVNSATIVVHDGISAIGGRISFSDQSIVFNPYSPLKRNTTYSVWVSKFVKVIDRDILCDDILYFFNTISDGEEEDSDMPLNGIADFSNEEFAVNFDLSYHDYQFLQSRIVKYDTDTLIGSDYNDLIKFTSLESGEIFNITGGTGFNTIDLSNYLSSDVSLIVGQTGENSGAITVSLADGGSALINFTDFHRIDFSKNNYTGSPHSFELDTSENASWSFNGETFSTSQPKNNKAIGLFHYAEKFHKNFNVNLVFYSYEDLKKKNGFLIFDYIDSNNYKYIKASTDKPEEWIIGMVSNGGDLKLVKVKDEIDTMQNISIELRVTRSEGKTAELWVDGVKKGEYTFADSLNDGLIGIGTDNAHTDFTINIDPSNRSS